MRYVAVILLMASSAYGQAITGVTGSVATDSSIVIYGSGFGTKDPAAPLLYDTVANQSDYESLNPGDTVPTRSDDCETCPWYSMSGRNPITYSTTSPRVEGGAFYRVTANGFLKQEDYGSASPKNIYVNWWLRISQAVPGTVSSKWIRLWRDNSGTEGRISWTQMHLTYYTDTNHDGVVDQSGIPHWGDWGGVTGEWNNLELECNSDDIEIGYGSLTAKTNGTVIHDIRQMWASAPLNYIDAFGFEPNISDNTINHICDWSEVYIDTSLARVMIGDASTFSACSHREIQIPSAWAADEITVTVNTGTFADDADVWLYVIDPDGNASVGYAVAVSSEYDGDPPTPDNAAVGAPTVTRGAGDAVTIEWTAPIPACARYQVEIKIEGVMHTVEVVGTESLTINIPDASDIVTRVLALEADSKRASTSAWVADNGI